MQLETVEFEGVLESHVKIFMFLAMKYIRTITGYDRNDLIQEQKIACYRAFDKYDPAGNISSFIYAVSENRLISIYKSERRKKRRPKQLTYLNEMDFESTGFLLAETHATGDEAYYVSELKLKIEDVAQVELSAFEYYLYQEIMIGQRNTHQLAVELNKEEKQIRNGISRIRRKLREKRDLIMFDV